MSMGRSWQEMQDKRIEKMIRAGMIDAGIKDLKQLAQASGLQYRTLTRRMKAAHEFTCGELYLISRVIKLQEVPL